MSSQFRGLDCISVASVQPSPVVAVVPVTLELVTVVLVPPSILGFLFFLHTMTTIAIIITSTTADTDAAITAMTHPGQPEPTLPATPTAFVELKFRLYISQPIAVGARAWREQLCISHTPFRKLMVVLPFWHASSLHRSRLLFVKCIVCIQDE